MKMTGRVGFLRAMSSASSGEYTTRTSAPAAFSAPKVVELPGTRIMSPNVVTIASGTRAMAMAQSMSWLEVTHTGHPGPDSSLSPLGMAERRP